MVWPEIEREAQIDQRRQFVALARAGAAEAIERFGRAVARVADQRRQRLAGGKIGERGDDHRVVGDEGVEVVIDFLCAVDVAMAGEAARVSVGEPQGVLVGFIGGFEPALRLKAIAQQIGDQAGVVIAKHGERRLLDLVERVERVLLVAGAGVAPGDEQRRRHVMRLAGFAGGELGAGGDVLAGGDCARGEREARQTVVGIAGDQPLGERKTVGGVAVGKRRRKGALDEIDIAGVGSQRLARKDRRCGGVAIGAGDHRSEIIARLALADRDRRTGVGRAAVAPAAAMKARVPPVERRALKSAARARRGETMSGTMRVPFRGAAARSAATEILTGEYLAGKPWPETLAGNPCRANVAVSRPLAALWLFAAHISG